MALTQITYTNKETLNEQPSIADINKVTADNMNEIKSVVNNGITKIDELTPTILYDNSSGGTGTINLSDNVNNYDYLEVYFMRGSLDYTGGCTKVIKSQYANFSGQFSIRVNNINRVYGATFHATGTTITINNEFYGNYMSETGSTSGEIKVLRVVGYK